MFNRELFRDLLIKARGERTNEDYSKASGVSRPYISAYLNLRRNDPPSPEILKRLSENAFNNITYEDFMKAAGYIPSNASNNVQNNNSTEKLNIPKEYTDKYKVTKRDKDQYKEFLKKEAEAFFMNDEFDEADKKELLDVMSEIFWEAKALNKRKPKSK